MPAASWGIGQKFKVVMVEKKTGREDVVVGVKRFEPKYFIKAFA